MELQDGMESLVVTQKKEWGEILTGFETKNRYVIRDVEGNELMYAAETGTGFLSRNFLKALRPWSILVTDTEGNTLLTIRRPFKFYFHRADVFNDAEEKIGSIVREWSWVRRIYRVLDAGGQELYRLFGPILHPWTFQIQEAGREIGKITKKWSGLAKEWFTDADNFGMVYPAQVSATHKDLLLAAVFLVDFVHFETNN